MPYKNKEDRNAYRKAYNLKNKEKIKARNKVYRENNREKVRAYANKWRERNNDTVASYALKIRYGVSLDEYNKLIECQDGCCAICKKHYSSFTKRLHVDHCHDTGKIRGLLCVNCNTAIGHFKESAELIKEASIIDRELLSTDSKKGFGKFSENIEYLQSAIKYLQQ